MDPLSTMQEVKEFAERMAAYSRMKAIDTDLSRDTRITARGAHAANETGCARMEGRDEQRVVVMGGDDVVLVCDCGPADTGACVADANRIKLALTCHGPLLAALETIVGLLAEALRAEDMDDIILIENMAAEAARAAVALAKGE